MKRYMLQYESDQMVCRRNNHTWGYASTLKTAKTYINKCRKQEAKYNPRNFRIYDTYGELDTEANYISCVYQEA